MPSFSLLLRDGIFNLKDSNALDKDVGYVHQRGENEYKENLKKHKSKP